MYIRLADASLGCSELAVDRGLYPCCVLLVAMQSGRGGGPGEQWSSRMEQPSPLPHMEQLKWLDERPILHWRRSSTILQDLAEIHQLITSLGNFVQLARYTSGQ